MASRSAAVTKPSAARSSSCFLRLGMTVSNAVDGATPRTLPDRSVRSTLRCASSAVVQSSAARSCRSSHALRLVQPPAGDTQAREEAQVRRLLESVAAPVPPAAHPAVGARDGLGHQCGGGVAEMRLRRELDSQPVRELEVVARQGAQRPGRRALEVLGRVQPRLVEVVPDDRRPPSRRRRPWCRSATRSRPPPTAPGSAPAATGRRRACAGCARCRSPPHRGTAPPSSETSAVPSPSFLARSSDLCDFTSIGR